MAQVQIGGAICSSISLNGNYSINLSGRDVGSTVSFVSALQGIGTATFDGQSKVTFSLTNNTNHAAGTTQTYSGTYSLQANCSGILTLTTGDTASFALESYNQGKDFLITGSDGTYSYTGSGSVLPSTCNAGLLTGVYAFNGTGFALSSGSITGVNNVSGVLQFDGTSAVSATWYVAANGSTTTTTASGQYSVTQGCGATATVSDSSGNSYSLVFTITSTTGANFSVSAASPLLMFTGSGRTALSVAGTCSASTLTGTRSIVLTGRDLNSSAILSQIYQAVGTANFNGSGGVSFALNVNTNQGQSMLQTLSGTYSIASNCVGSLNITSGDSSSFTLLPYNYGKNFVITGQDGTYALTGSGGTPPVTCATATFSGDYTFSGTGFLLSGSSVAGVNTIAGLLQFDGAGAVTGNWQITGSGSPVSVTVTGNYSVAPACIGTATVTNTSGASYSVAFTVTSSNGGDFAANVANASAAFSVSGHSAFVNPGLSVVNAASYAASSTPPGSIFSLFGSGLATGQGYPAKVPLPTTLLSTSVTVNGEAAPLFYVGPVQIDAQMPVDIQPGLATVVVKNGTSTSNTVGVVVPATGTPGIFFYNANRAVVVNPDGTLNSPVSPAHVGDVLVGYLTGGGPVTAAGPWITGAASPLGLSGITETYSVTVGSLPAVVNYLGLAPGEVGVYQLNFVVPAVAAGTRAVVVTINGTASVGEVITVAN
jgi:uncharacterized protein (TIGR03437 family)